MKTLIINAKGAQTKYNLIILFGALLIIGIYTNLFNGLKSVLLYNMFCLL